MLKLNVDIDKKLQALENKKKERVRRKTAKSTKLVSAPPKKVRKRRRKTIPSVGPVTLRKVPRNYEEAKALYGTAWYNEWRDYVLARDGAICQMCGQRARTLEVHHIRPKYLYPELTLDKDNGITLCKNCHQDRVTKHEHRFAYIFDRIVKANKQET